MSSRAATSGPSARALAKRDAARNALAICATADRLAEEATTAVGVDDDRLFALLEQREEMLADLAEHIVALRLERPTVDNPLIASSERAVDEADALVTEVCDAISASQRATMVLAARLADRVADLRAEIASVQRVGQAGLGYTALDVGARVDRVR